MEEGITVLRDGCRATVRSLTPGDLAEVAALLEGAGDARVATVARGQLAAGAAAIVARALPDGRLLGYAAWSRPEGALVCAVEPAASGIGVGTLLVRAAAGAAAEQGLRRLAVALHPHARALGALIRDCGLRSHWDLEHPLARVELLLGERRPGWATP